MGGGEILPPIVSQHVARITHCIFKGKLQMCTEMLWYRTAPPTTEFTKTQTHMLTLRLYNTLCEMKIPLEVFCVVDFKLGPIHAMRCLYFIAPNQETLPIIWAVLPYGIFNLGSLRECSMLLTNQKWKSKL